MPRSQQSREGGIVNYFATAPLEIAAVVLKLSQDQLRARVQRSEEARQRALKGQKAAGGSARVVPPPKAKPAVAAPARPARSHKKGKGKKAKPQHAHAQGRPHAELDDFDARDHGDGSGPSAGSSGD